MSDCARTIRDRLVRIGLIGAGVLTLTWWTLLAVAVWHAVAWAAA